MFADRGLVDYLGLRLGLPPSKGHLYLTRPRLPSSKGHLFLLGVDSPLPRQPEPSWEQGSDRTSPLRSTTDLVLESMERVWVSSSRSWTVSSSCYHVKVMPSRHFQPYARTRTILPQRVLAKRGCVQRRSQVGYTQTTVQGEPGKGGFITPP